MAEKQREKQKELTPREIEEIANKRLDNLLKKIPAGEISNNLKSIKESLKDIVEQNIKESSKRKLSKDDFDASFSYAKKKQTEYFDSEVGISRKRAEIDKRKYSGVLDFVVNRYLKRTFDVVGSVEARTRGVSQIFDYMANRLGKVGSLMKATYSYVSPYYEQRAREKQAKSPLHFRTHIPFVSSWEMVKEPGVLEKVIMDLANAITEKELKKAEEGAIEYSYALMKLKKKETKKAENKGVWNKTVFALDKLINGRVENGIGAVVGYLSNEKIGKSTSGFLNKWLPRLNPIKWISFTLESIWKILGTDIGLMAYKTKLKFNKNKKEETISDLFENKNKKEETPNKDFIEKQKISDWFSGKPSGNATMILDLCQGILSVVSGIKNLILKGNQTSEKIYKETEDNNDELRKANAKKLKENWNKQDSIGQTQQDKGWLDSLLSKFGLPGVNAEDLLAGYAITKNLKLLKPLSALAGGAAAWATYSGGMFDFMKLKDGIGAVEGGETIAKTTKNLKWLSKIKAFGKTTGSLGGWLYPIFDAVEGYSKEGTEGLFKGLSKGFLKWGLNYLSGDLFWFVDTVLLGWAPKLIDWLTGWNLTGFVDKWIREPLDFVFESIWKTIKESLTGKIYLSDFPEGGMTTGLPTKKPEDSEKTNTQTFSGNLKNRFSKVPEGISDEAMATALAIREKETTKEGDYTKQHPGSAAFGAYGIQPATWAAWEKEYGKGQKFNRFLKEDQDFLMLLRQQALIDKQAQSTEPETIKRRKRLAAHYSSSENLYDNAKPQFSQKDKQYYPSIRDYTLEGNQKIERILSEINNPFLNGMPINTALNVGDNMNKQIESLEKTKNNLEAQQANNTQKLQEQSAKNTEQMTKTLANQAKQQSGNSKTSESLKPSVMVNNQVNSATSLVGGSSMPLLNNIPTNIEDLFLVYGSLLGVGTGG